MGSKVLVTYKRKRLFSRSDHPHLDLHSDAHPKISASKSSVDFNALEKQTSEHMLPNKESDVEARHECSQRNVGKNMLQCENCNSHNLDAKERQLVDSAAQSNVEEKPSDAQSKPLSVKSGLDYKCEEKVLILPSCDACSVVEWEMSDEINCSRQMDTCISGAFTSEETDKPNKYRDGSLCNGLGTTHKWSTALLTYQRKSKRKRNVFVPDTASELQGLKIASETQPGCTLMALKDEKKSPEDIDESPAPATGITTAVQVDGPAQLHLVTAKSTAPTITKFPREPHPRDIDCNLPPVSGLDDSDLAGPSEPLPDSLGSTGKGNEDMQTVQAPRRDKGKSIVESLPVLGGMSSKNAYLQLFPENSSGNALRLPNDQEKLRRNGQAGYYPSYPWLPSVQVHPRESFHDFILPTPDQAQSFARQKMMLDNILTRARAARGNQSIFPDAFRPPTFWSEEELDCLWIGVRRHGRGNWETILRDRRLQFSPWKTSRDLADKWQEEQTRLFQNPPISQVRYAVNSVPLDRVNSLLHPQVTPVNEAQISLGNGYGVIPNGHFFHPMNLQQNGQLQQPGRNPGAALFAYGYYSPSECSGKGSLPHWLREAVDAPATQSGNCLGMQRVGQPNADFPGNAQQPLRVPTERRNGARNGGTGRGKNAPLVVSQGRNEGNGNKGSKPDGLIVIASDASSEETISDDRNARG